MSVVIAKVHGIYEWLHRRKAVLPLIAVSVIAISLYFDACKRCDFTTNQKVALTFHLIGLSLTVLGMIEIWQLTHVRHGRYLKIQQGNLAVLFPWILWLTQAFLFYGFLLLRDFAVLDMTSVLWWKTSIFLNMWSNVIRNHALGNVLILGWYGNHIVGKRPMLHVRDTIEEQLALVQQIKDLNGE